MAVTAASFASGLAGIGAAPAAGKGKDEAAKVADAATQFEALLIEQMLKTSREAGGGGWMGGDESSSALSEMAEQQFAGMLAAGGGLGLAKLVKSGLSVAAEAARVKAAKADL